MHLKTIAIDLAKDVFELAVASPHGQILARQRLTRSKLFQFLQQQEPGSVVMEACGSAHYWARLFQAQGHQVTLLPAQYVRPYRRRNKTDRADVLAILEAYRCAQIKPVPIKSVEQQQLQHCHRLREQWKHTRTARINALRALLREQGVVFPLGANAFIKAAPLLIDEEPALTLLQPLLHALLAEISLMEQHMLEAEGLLKRATSNNPAVARLQQINGIGLLTSTALVAAVGNPATFKRGRQLANWIGITPREHSSGNTRRLGSITRQGDVYLRTLFIHGARSALARAKQIASANPEALTKLQRWAVQIEERRGFNKAAVALANKLVRIAWAVWNHARRFDGDFAVATTA